jgi:hypothetical protein
MEIGGGRAFSVQSETDFSDDRVRAEVEVSRES